ncbi:MAG TPA: type VII secretion target [Micromonosporaceae bacterium]
MTAPAPDIGVSPDELRTHATHLDAIASEMGADRQAAAVTRPGPAAYGRLCLAVPVLLDLLQTPLTDAIGAAVDSVHTTADTLRGIAGGYQEADDYVDAMMRDEAGTP